MHPNPSFRKPDDVQNITFARERGFGVLALNHDDGPLVSHIPFALTANGVTADLHLVRSNPILRLLDTPQKAVIAVTAADGYVSPDWYEVPDQVPTWNYVAVHLRGTLERLPQDAMRDMLDRQSAHFEDQLAPKPPWLTTKMTPDVLDKMMRQIVPCRLHVSAINGTWKLSQNKPDDVRLRAADKIETSTTGIDTQTLAHLMRHPPQN
ncbi:MAG: FMN-binding negative transcriptional regulator [Yoonia sp.]|uniref:FMN-binding negative transcriptional regulator n=1 Tax=Yoonia sp. TaxID=2212373 RepID=UPI0032668735